MIACCFNKLGPARNRSRHRRRALRDSCYSSIMETKPPVPRAILVGIQVPSVDDIAHAAGIEELSRLVKTLGYEVVGTMSQKDACRRAIDSLRARGLGRAASQCAGGAYRRCCRQGHRDRR